jgi:hypothetical protein
VLWFTCTSRANRWQRSVAACSWLGLRIAAGSADRCRITTAAPPFPAALDAAYKLGLALGIAELLAGSRTAFDIIEFQELEPILRFEYFMTPSFFFTLRNACTFDIHIAIFSHFS